MSDSSTQKGEPLEKSKKEMEKILIIEDNETMREGMAYTLKKEYSVATAPGGREGLELFKSDEFDVVITDLKMEGVDGLAVLEEVKKLSPETPVIIVTAFGSIDVAVKAMQMGAWDFIAKPFTNDLLRAKVKKALSQRKLQKKTEILEETNRALQRELAEPYFDGQLIGKSPEMQKLFRLIDKVAPTDTTVHIFGESGTGKELVARAIHNRSSRKNGPFIKVSCSALPETLLESELFGYEKGAFTNATRRKLGRFELAHGGTLFLDEIGDISPVVQVKLLRVLQEREFERVGGENSVKVDVRIISATNKDLQKEVEAGRFREDLFYRLHILPISIPPLRQRPEDIEPLVQHFLKKLKRRTRHQVERVDPQVIEIFKQYPWPGNIRELENVMEQMLVLSEGPVLTPDQIPPHIAGTKLQPKDTETKEGEDPLERLRGRTLAQYLDDVEREIISAAYRKAKGVKSEVAKLLGVKLSALYYKLEKYQIGKDSEK